MTAQTGIPKSLHTVRILVSVARLIMSRGGKATLPALLDAAEVCGYSEASQNDPLILAALKQLSK
jgi:hypothetical protein